MRARENFISAVTPSSTPTPPPESFPSRFLFTPLAARHPRGLCAPARGMNSPCSGSVGTALLPTTNRRAATCSSATQHRGPQSTPSSARCPPAHPSRLSWNNSAMTIPSCPSLTTLTSPSAGYPHVTTPARLSTPSKATTFTGGAVGSPPKAQQPGWSNRIWN